MLAIMLVAAAEDVPGTRLLAGAGAAVSIVLAPGLTAAILFVVAIPLAQLMTVVADNPAVNGADWELTTTLPIAFSGLAVAAATLAVIRLPADSGAGRGRAEAD